MLNDIIVKLYIEIPKNQTKTILLNEWLNFFNLGKRYISIRLYPPPLTNHALLVEYSRSGEVSVRLSLISEGVILIPINTLIELI